MCDSINRRDFLKKTGAATLSAGLVSYLGSRVQSGAQPARTVGPNDTIVVAVIGTNGRGLAHIEALDLPGVKIAYICDVDDKSIAKGLRACEKTRSKSPKGIKDFRKVLEDKSVDAITIATPDHWHTPMAILGLQAGKHVYVEKPCSQNPREGELLLEALSKCGGICQMGNQRRSFPNMHQAMKELHDGIIGKLYFARAWYENRRSSIGHGKVVPVPANLDYDLWQGPAPRRPYHNNVIHYNWHWFWHWGTGEALNNGTHEVDVCRWALGVDWPVRVSSNGGRYQYEDDWQTPDTQVITWDYAEGKTISWEGRSCNDFPGWAGSTPASGALHGLERGAIVYGAEGAALLDSNNYTVFDRKNKIIKQVKGNEKVDATNTISASGIHLDQLHFVNFLECVRSGQQPNSPISEGHKSVTMLHLGNIAWRVRRGLDIDNSNGHIQHDEDAMKLWQREYEPGWAPKV